MHLFSSRVSGVSHGDGFVVVRLSGEIDLAAAADVTRTLESVARARPGPVLVDLAAVSFLDCSGYRALDRARKTTQRMGGVLVLVGGNRVVRRALALLEAPRAFPFVECLDEAVRCYSSERDRVLVSQQRQVGDAPDTVPG